MFIGQLSSFSAFYFVIFRGQKCVETSSWSNQGATVPSHLEENWIGTRTRGDQTAVQPTAA